jgi:hypothetical protein
MQRYVRAVDARLQTWLTSHADALAAW